MPVQIEYEITTIKFKNTWHPQAPINFGGILNKLGLISALREKTDISKSEAAKTEGAGEPLKHIK